ncbi:Ig-like domain-containing protein [uncultured Methanobrevibacter sp.]|uniref:Ig-like domain-containing protein n=1 Tax=uncultured Methanobrevibacter sp. TaxID=253161 RepID=UPI0025F1723E|nr:Ig-like domain repeat protein [uncultured Methanobrevibacter sp.]
MKIKYVISICIFVILMSMSCISASENVNQTDSLGLSIEDNFETAENDQKIIRSTNNEDELKENKNQTMNSNILAISNEDEILGANDIYVKGDTFESISDAIQSAQAGDTIHLNGTYTNNWKKHIEIDREISIIGKDNATLDAQGFSRIFYVTSGKINIQNVVFKNGNADNGGAIYFENTISNSNINATFINNTAIKEGGANYFKRHIENSNISGTYTNNTAGMAGGANYFMGHLRENTITGTYTSNKATAQGGANYFGEYVGWSNITGTYINNKADSAGTNYIHNFSNWNLNVGGIYINNTATSRGGANIFRMVGDSNITGIYINNTAKRGGGTNIFNQVSNSNIGGIYINNTAPTKDIIQFDNYDSHEFDAQIKNAIFLNNNCTYEISANYGGVVVKDSWFGNNASNYMNKPNINYDNVTIDNWLFLNATADYTSPSIMESSNITFKLYSTDGENVSDFDNSNLHAVNLTLTASNGDVDKTTQLDKTVKYKATSKGTGTVTAKIENAQYTIYFDNNLRNVDLSVSAENITYLENEILTLTYNNTATGKVNITLNSTKYNKKIEADINHTITIADLPAGEYNVTVEYFGDNVFSNATSYANFIVEKMPTEVIVDKKTMDLFVDDEFKITYTLNPDYAVGNITFSSDDSNIVGVDSVSGDIQAKAEGTAIITVTFGGSENYTASSTNITITVSKIPTEINITNETVELKALKNISGLATLNPKWAGNLTYTSSDENIVVASDDGIIYARIKGTAIVTVSFAGDDKYKAAESKNITVTVTLNDARVSVENDTLDLFVDDTCMINATANPQSLTVNYTSSDESVATVTDYGNVKAVGEGTAVITLTVGDGETYAINYTYVKVTVSKIPTEILITNETLDLKVNDKVDSGAGLNPSEAGNLTYMLLPKTKQLQ